MNKYFFVTAFLLLLPVGSFHSQGTGAQGDLRTTDKELNLYRHAAKQQCPTLFVTNGSNVCECHTGLGPPVLSYTSNCVHCLPSPYGWFLYFFLACFPSTVFFLLVILLQIRANSSQLNFFLLACQFVALLPEYQRLSYLCKGYIEFLQFVELRVLLVRYTSILC